MGVSRQDLEVSKEPFGRNILYYAPWRHFTTVRHSSGELSSCSILSTRRLLIERYDHTHSLPSIISSVTSCSEGVAVTKGLESDFRRYFPKQKTAKNMSGGGRFGYVGNRSVKFVLGKYTSAICRSRVKERCSPFLFFDSDSAPPTLWELPQAFASP